MKEKKNRQIGGRYTQLRKNLNNFSRFVVFFDLYRYAELVGTSRTLQLPTDLHLDQFNALNSFYITPVETLVHTLMLCTEFQTHVVNNLVLEFDLLGKI